MLATWEPYHDSSPCIAQLSSEQEQNKGRRGVSNESKREEMSEEMPLKPAQEVFKRGTEYYMRRRGLIILPGRNHGRAYVLKNQQTGLY